MKRARILSVMAVAVVLVATSCSSGDGGDEDAMDGRLRVLSGAGVFVGGVAFTTTLVGLHLDRTVSPPYLSMYVADGMPGGTAEWFQGRAEKDLTFRFTSASGKATIEGKVADFETDGTVKLPDGSERVFFTRPAGDGAGVFEVTIDAAGAWNGRSLDGSVMEADQTGTDVEGFVRSATGNLYRFRHNDMTRRLGYSRPGGEPGTYMLIVTRRATEVVGRSGDVRTGKPGDGIVALDLAASDVPTPGIFYGRVADTTDKLAFDLNPLPDGSRQVRAYVSDAEPEPAGDVEWFSAPVTGPTFAITSASGSARIDGTIADDGITGMITLPSQTARRYYAAPAGDGAGIYDVTVRADRSHVGASEEGGKLDLSYRDGMVMGVVTAPTGQQIDLLGADLVHTYRYGIEGSVPDTYVAFAAPNGRYLIGRSGNVRGGTGGLNIIGLDKKC